jgi:hypothetical protein
VTPPWRCTAGASRARCRVDQHGLVGCVVDLGARRRPETGPPGPAASARRAHGACQFGAQLASRLADGAGVLMG